MLIEKNNAKIAERLDKDSYQHAAIYLALRLT